MTALRRTRVLLVDDHPLLREGLGVLIGTTSDLEVVGEAGHIDEARAIATRVDVDVALVDVLMPPGCGIAVTRALLELQPACRVLGFSVVEEPAVVAAMLRAGAVGFALKTEPPNQILEAMRSAVSGARYLPRSVSTDAVELALVGAAPDVDPHLTKREREIFDLIIRGYTNAEISARLFIARRTVETHRHRIVKKFGARSVTDMQRWAAQQEHLSS
jgi:DNA-binding NarL/FixJ family response regulator